MRRGLWLIVVLLVVAGGVLAVILTGGKRVPATEESSAATGPAASQPSADAGKLCVITANVRFSDPSDGINAWPNRRELLVKTLLKYNPDIVGCQEVTPAQGAYLNKELAAWYGYYPRAGVGKSGGTAKSHTGQLLGQITETFASLNTLYYRLSRFDLIDGTAGLAVPEEPQADASENTFFTLAVLREKASGHVMLVVDTHIRHQAAFAVKCVERIRAQIGAMAKKYPHAGIIMMGDMNHDRTSPVYRALLGGPRNTDGAGELADCFDYTQKKPNELWGNWHEFTGVSKREWPSDLILVNTHFASEGAVLVKDGGEKGIWPSDHFFVRVELDEK